MNFFITEVLVTVAVIVLVDGSSVEYYATKYDHLDVEEALSNRRMVKYYANCLLSRGPCTPQGLELKKILPEALETNCLRCTPRQKAVTYQAIKRLRKEYPKTWALLEAKWDPNNVHVKKFEESFQQKPSQGSYENEILIENRFGDTDSENNSPPTTSKAVTKKTKATSLRSSSVKPSTTKSSTPSSNSIASASDKRPSTIPPNTQNPLVNVTNQVIQLHNLVSSMISNLINFKMALIHGFIHSG